MIEKLLIANRGEIVCRIARTAHRMGVSTVGVYSEADRNALHVDQVDVAVALGGNTPAQSYLRADAVIEAALAQGADAVHPGYGFLSESADFAQAVIDAGLTWVGPTPPQIRLLGDKIAAKTAAETAGVPTTTMVEVSPGSAPAGLSMPILVKAAAGGGGRGMRIVRQHLDVAEAIESAAREAEAAFGDGTVFIEPYIERGRHVEVQIIGDASGHILHLGERECSIQRRNQKIIEEAPSPGISEETRDRLCSAAVALASHVGYENAGTVEFMVGEDGTINFLEVNTRLQVEHPVTEAVTGVDLVEWQLRIASGQLIPLAQEDITIDGHAIEARIVAEDPATGWLPSIGNVARFEIGSGTRVETGISVGSAITPDYDSMIAKVIAHGDSREDAAAVLARSLRSSAIAGVQTNVGTVVSILTEPDFLAGATLTSYLDEHPETVTTSAMSEDESRALLGAATMVHAMHARADNSATGFAPGGWRNLRTQGQRRVFQDGSASHHVEYVQRGNDVTMRFGPWPEPDEEGVLGADERVSHEVTVLRFDESSIAIEIDGVRTAISYMAADGALHVASPSGSASFTLEPTFVEHDVERDAGGPICPLPGTVIAVHVEAGDRVDEGQLLVVIEAMKMEHKIVASHEAIVEEVRFATGDRVDTGDLLVTLA